MENDIYDYEVFYEVNVEVDIDDAKDTDILFISQLL